jgi:hypothetical protein
VFQLVLSGWATSSRLSLVRSHILGKFGTFVIEPHQFRHGSRHRVARASGATRSSRLVPRLIQDDVSVVRRFRRHGGLSARYIFQARISRECEHDADDTSSFDEKDKRIESV